MNRHFFRELVLIFAAALIFSAISGAALADAIWEPEDDFYTAHAEECEYINSQFYSNGKTGYFELFNKPDGASVGFSDNGLLYYVSFSYSANGETWGIVEYSEQDGKLVPTDYSEQPEAGWVRLADTIEKYNSRIFSADHSEELTDYTGDASSLLECSELVTWTYPGSGESYGKIDMADADPDFPSFFSTSYTDEEGREWLYCSYYRGNRDFWICLSDPQNDALPATNAKQPEFIEPASEELPEPSGNNMTTTILICVAAVVVISLLLIVLLGRRKKNTAQ